MSPKNDARHLPAGGLGLKVPAKRGISVGRMGFRGENRVWWVCWREIANGKMREAIGVISSKWVSRWESVARHHLTECESGVGQWLH